MASFKDSSGRDWRLDLTYGVILEVKETTGIDFDLMIENHEKFSAIFLTHPGKLIDILWGICKEQAEAIGMSTRSFAGIFDRGTLDRATNALIESILTFYPRSSVGKTITRKLPQMLRKMDEKLEKEMNAMIDKELNSPDGLSGSGTS